MLRTRFFVVKNEGSSSCPSLKQHGTLLSLVE